MSKKISGYVKLQLPAGKANPAPPVGTVLGPRGVNLMEFCKGFNAKTQGLGDVIVPVVVTVYEDRSFTFITKVSPMSDLIKTELKLEKGSTAPGKEGVGTLNADQIRKIAETKMPDLNTNDMEQAMKIVAGSARSMGVGVEL